MNSVIEIIDNLNVDSNHNVKIRECISKSTDLLFASPFLLRDFNDFFQELDLSLLESITLLTTLKPRDRDQFSKIDSLVSFCDFFHELQKNVKINIYINNFLHGKVYLFKNTNNYVAGIITSANFTEPGLSRNFEWGISINDTNLLIKIENDVFHTIEKLRITEDELLKCLYEIDEYRLKNPQAESNIIDLDLNKFLPENKQIIFEDNKSYWIKPIGVTGKPINEGESFEDSPQRLDFSKRRPSGVNIGDIMICYAVRNGKLLSVYEVTSSPIKSTKAEINEDPWRERWPWSVQGINLTSIYGSKWWKHDLYLTTLADEYNKKSLNDSLTYRGGRTLGGLNYGSDKIRLSSGFANYLIEKIKKYNE